MSKEQTMEINPGIILYKEQKENAGKLYYEFKIEVKKMKMVEFVADFNGSENIEIEGRNNLITVTNIDPFQKKIIANLLLRRDWKLKSKFKFTLKTPPIDIQEKYLGLYLEEIGKFIDQANHTLRDVPFSIMSITEANKVLVANNVKYIDLDFVPNDVNQFLISGKHLL